VRTRLLNVLLVAALVLAVSRLWMFLGEPPPALPVVDTGAPLPAAPANKSGQDAEIAAAPPEAYDAIVARDLFSPTRGVMPPAAAAAAQPPPKQQPAPKLTLYGVVIVDGEKSAYLQEGNQEGRPRKVREHENFAGGVVKTIRPDGLTFLFAGSEINVPLRTPKPGAGTAATPRGQDAGGAVPRSEAPVAFPRRQTPTRIQQGQMPAPGRPGVAVPGMPGAVAPVEPGGEVFGDEEFPEGSMPGGEAPGLMEEEAGD
jgi:hypothetical protein